MEYFHRSALHQESRAIRELCRNCESLVRQGGSQTLINARKKFLSYASTYAETAGEY